jgi:hypothetical protein
VGVALFVSLEVVMVVPSEVERPDITVHQICEVCSAW